MTNHYYNSNLDVKSNIKNFEFTLRNKELNFSTDHGVFSKEQVDYGTRALLKQLIILKNEFNLLDMGCGYGPIGISLAKEFECATIDMVDINERALNLSRENAKKNGVSNVTIVKSNVYEAITSNYNYIVSNPPIRAGKKIVHQIIENSTDHLKPDGELWIVIQKKQGAPSAKVKMETIFGNCDTIKRDRGYYILKSTKK